MPNDLNLDFSSAINGTILDKDGQGTGFTSVQPNTTGDAYDFDRINLNTSASSLVLTGTQGSHGGSTNTLKNGLQVGIDANQPFTISTRLKGPLTNLNNAYQQGGIFLGPDQDNYVKLVITNTSSGSNGIGLQFNQEQNGVRSNVGEGSEIRGINWSSINTLDLFLKGNPATGTIEAAYRVNSDTDTPTSFIQQFKPSSDATFFADQTTARAGILAFTKDAADTSVTFDDFSIQYTQGNGNIQVKTPDVGIVQNRIVFSTVNEEVRAPKTLTLRNTGSGPLQITGLNLGDSQEKDNAVRIEDHQRIADFKLVNAPQLPITLQPNQSHNLSVQFAPHRVASLNASDSPTHTRNGENYASITITSDDPDQPQTQVNLAGMNSANYEGNNEVSVAEIARTYGWSLNVGKEDNILGSSKTRLGDEVYSPYWLRADTTKPVLLWPLAVYSGRNNSPHDSIRFEAKPGSEGKSGLIYELAGRNNDDSPTGNEVLGSNNLSGGENQKLLPKILANNVNSVPKTSTVDFTPTSPFALNRGGAWTDDSKNGTSKLHNWRIFPVQDAKGNLVSNTWFAAVDPGNNPDPATGKNFDYNDDVYLLVNAKPE